MKKFKLLTIFACFIVLCSCDLTEFGSPDYCGSLVGLESSCGNDQLTLQFIPVSGGASTVANIVTNPPPNSFQNVSLEKGKCYTVWGGASTCSVVYLTFNGNNNDENGVVDCGTFPFYKALQNPNLLTLQYRICVDEDCGCPTVEVLL